MKCHYEVLGISRDAGDDEIKKAYRKLALRWHPDKNQGNEDEAKENFQLVQQAYDVLTDSHERAWYDNHREAVLKGGLGQDYKDDSVNLFPYFSASCFQGYNDDPTGFYAVYEEVFNKLAAEDSEHVKEDDPEAPGFGRSDSSYEEIVAPFYSYWMGYSTRRTFAWLDKYDTRDAPNRKIGKLIEKDNKKIRDQAKKERNDQIRNLVAFVRKRDKRVQAWNKILEERAKENQRKSELNRLKQIEERKIELKQYKESEWSKFSKFENELQQIEQNLAKEFGDEVSADEDSNEDEYEDNSCFCVACNKVFKTEKAFANHEKSKRHKVNVELLKQNMVAEDEMFISDEDRTHSAKESDVSDSGQGNENEAVAKTKKKQKKVKVVESSENDSDLEMLSTSKQKRRNRGKNEASDNESEKKRKGKPEKLEKKLEDLNLVEEQEKKEESSKTESENQMCAKCNANFPSKNKLFNHLKKTGHSVYLERAAQPENDKKSTAKKGKKNRK